MFSHAQGYGRHVGAVQKIRTRRIMSPWPTRVVRAAVPAESPGQVHNYAGIATAPSAALIAQGTILRTAQPRGLGVVETRKAVLMRSKPLLRTLGFAGRAKQLMRDKLEILPSPALHFYDETELPDYITNVTTIGDVPTFAVFPVFARRRPGVFRGRDVRTGFLKTRLVGSGTSIRSTGWHMRRRR